MPKKQEKQKVSIDGVDYLLDDLPETAKAQLVNIQFVDSQLEQLKNEWAIADTARMGYTAALKKELSETENTQK